MRENYVLPFLWVHGEEEETYRKMVRVIHQSGIGAFCVEARPHPQFVQEKWWQDMAVLLDEAEKLEMQVWILDDKHFPTGYAAGAVENAPLKLKRRHIIHQSIPVRSRSTFRRTVRQLADIRERGKIAFWNHAISLYGGSGLPKRLGKNELVACTAFCGDQVLDLMPYIRDGVLRWKVPEGNWTVEVCALTYDSGAHRNYINMIDPDSCRLLIDAVYEPHYAHFGDKFGSVIAGFFSDEPELGNGSYAVWDNVLGTEQSLPYSDDLAKKLAGSIGPDWKQKLPLLWKNGVCSKETVRVRYAYMDAVTRLVEECFSFQLGNWCRAHGVDYIGHVIEDNNQHARTGTSLGHYFRGLKWQSMAGIDDIGGQVYPGGQDSGEKNIFGTTADGEFYHYALGKLASSMAEITPHMQGNSMCEIFGNYGWTEGVRLEKYLLDHFMVRGINHFVPHAFTCKPYPDQDCPPHFYAQGNNPQYRHFRALMDYTNRVCSLLHDTKPDIQVAILYHGEAEWTGKRMLMQKPARVLWDRQVDYRFIPGDVFTDREFYRTRISDVLRINGHDHKLLIVPYAQFLPDGVLEGIGELIEKGGSVIFLDGLPDHAVSGKAVPKSIRKAQVMILDELAEAVQPYRTVLCREPSDRLRVQHRVGKNDFYYFFNEASEPYSGKVRPKTDRQLSWYDPWKKVFYPTSCADGWYDLNLAPEQGLFLMEKADQPEAAIPAPNAQMEELRQFHRSVCRSVDYPSWGNAAQVAVPEDYGKDNPRFSGILRYERSVNADPSKHTWLRIEDAGEAVEVFLNGKSLGIQITPPYIYDLTDALCSGENRLAIEVATTLAGERLKKAGAAGLTGSVYFITEEAGGSVCP